MLDSIPTSLQSYPSHLLDCINVSHQQPGSSMILSATALNNYWRKPSMSPSQQQKYQQILKQHQDMPLHISSQQKSMHLLHPEHEQQKCHTIIQEKILTRKIKSDESFNSKEELSMKPLQSLNSSSPVSEIRQEKIVANAGDCSIPTSGPIDLYSGLSVQPFEKHLQCSHPSLCIHQQQRRQPWQLLQNSLVKDENEIKRFNPQSRNPVSGGKKRIALTTDRMKNPCKVFVGGIGQGTIEKTVRSHFCQYGVVLDCAIVTHKKSGKSRGFGFITYDSQEAAARAVKAKHKIDDVLVECRQALPRDEARITAPHDSLYIPTKIFVGGIPEIVQEDDFKNFFSKFGDVLDVSLAYDKSNHRPRGFGFIVFSSLAAAHAAVGRHYLCGKSIEAKHAVPRDPPRIPRGRGVNKGLTSASSAKHTNEDLTKAINLEIMQDTTKNSPIPEFPPPPLSQILHPCLTSRALSCSFDSPSYSNSPNQKSNLPSSNVNIGMIPLPTYNNHLTTPTEQLSDTNQVQSWIPTSAPQSFQIAFPNTLSPLYRPNLISLNDQQITNSFTNGKHTSHTSLNEISKSTDEQCDYRHVFNDHSSSVVTYNQLTASPSFSFSPTITEVVPMTPTRILGSASAVNQYIIRSDEGATVVSALSLNQSSSSPQSNRLLIQEHASLPSNIYEENTFGSNTLLSKAPENLNEQRLPTSCQNVKTTTTTTLSPHTSYECANNLFILNTAITKSPQTNHHTGQYASESSNPMTNSTIVLTPNQQSVVQVSAPTSVSCNSPFRTVVAFEQNGQTTHPAVTWPSSSTTGSLEPLFIPTTENDAETAQTAAIFSRDGSQCSVQIPPHVPLWSPQVTSFTQHIGSFDGSLMNGSPIFTFLRAPSTTQHPLPPLSPDVAHSTAASVLSSPQKTFHQGSTSLVVPYFPSSSCTSLGSTSTPTGKYTLPQSRTESSLSHLSLWEPAYFLHQNPQHITTHQSSTILPHNDHISDHINGFRIRSQNDVPFITDSSSGFDGLSISTTASPTATETSPTTPTGLDRFPAPSSSSSYNLHPVRSPTIQSYGVSSLKDSVSPRTMWGWDTRKTPPYGFSGPVFLRDISQQPFNFTTSLLPPSVNEKGSTSSLVFPSSPGLPVAFTPPLSGRFQL